MQFTISNHESASTRLIETQTLTNFKQFLLDNSCKCRVNVAHTSLHFWLTQQERGYLNGCIGAIGSNGAQGCSYNTTDTRPIAVKERVEVQINFTIEVSIAEKISKHIFILTENHVGETLKTVTSYKVSETNPYMCGVYKRPGFDSVYKAIKTMKPNLTELELAKFNIDEDSCQDFDDDLVELRLFEGGPDCIYKFKNQTYHIAGKSNVCITVLLCDLDSNLDYIQSILLSAL